MYGLPRTKISTTSLGERLYLEIALRTDLCSMSCSLKPSRNSAQGSRGAGTGFAACTVCAGCGCSMTGTAAGSVCVVGAGTGTTVAQLAESRADRMIGL